MAFRWGLIGAGDIVAKRVGTALRDASGSELVAIARARANLAESSAANLGARRWYARWQDLVADPEIDALYIATPVHLHAPQAIAATEAGKHVLCEKPMAMNIAECDRMLAAARAHGVKLGIAYYRHFYPVIARISEILASGEIGQPVLVQMNAFERFNPPPGEPRHWLIEPERAGGGPMFDFGCHRLEVLLTLFGAVERVTSMVENIAFAREVEDTAIAVLRFQTGPCATVSVSHAILEPQDTLDILGTEGSVHVATLNKGDLRVCTPRGERREAHAPAANLHLPLVQDFVDQVSRGREPAVNGELGRAVAAIEEAIYVTTRSSPTD